MTPLETYGPLGTGKQAWASALEKLARPAIRRAALGPGRQPANASTNDPLATWWELVTRPLWGLAALEAGAQKAEPSRAEYDLWPMLQHTIERAVDPEDPWYIGDPRDRHQCLVEAAALGFAVSRLPWLHSDNVDRWLALAAAAEPVDNNWHYFPVLAGETVGGDAEAHLARIDEFSTTDGWYQDGFTERYDYYNPFGFHFYNALLGRPPSENFARQFEHWFAADGSAVPFGRSLAYRFAQGAYWGALAYSGVEVLPWATVRGLAERHLRWWWEQPILDGEGLLTVGYRYPNDAIVEQYIGGGSPYWATKFFLPLALPDDHPFWTVTPDWTPRDGVSAQPAAKAVLSRHDGHVVLLNGQGWADWARGGGDKYAKFAYSTRAGFSVGAFDCMLALSDDGGRHWRGREAVDESRVEGDVVWARWRPWDDVTIDTWLKPMGAWHIRAHRIVTARALDTAEGGFCLPWTERELPSHGGEIVDPHRSYELITPMAGSNVLHPRTVLPTLRATLAPGEHLLTCAIRDA
jgi:hypothetical protein